MRPFMRPLKSAVALLVVALFPGYGESASTPARPATASRPATPAKPQTLLSWHWLGTAQLATNSQAAPWKAYGDEPAFGELWRQTAHKLSRTPGELARNLRAPGTDDFAALFEPMLDDLLRHESAALLRRLSNQTPEFALALRLPDARAQAWQTNLATVLSAWTTLVPQPAGAGAPPGWELKKHDPPNRLRFNRANGWVLLSAGQDELSLHGEFLSAIQKQGRPPGATGTNWLTLLADWPRLQTVLPMPFPVAMPAMDLALNARKDALGSNNLRLAMLWKFDQPHQWKHEPWRFPTNLIRDPLISFTAAQGIAPLLRAWPEFARFKVEPTPNQAYVWALSQIPFQTFLAMPYRNPTNLLARVAPEVAAAYNPAITQQRLGSLYVTTNSPGLAWRGLPFLVPFIQGVTEPSGDFLVSGLFTKSPQTNPAPAELLSQVLTRTNLAYYDWEVSEPRLQQWRQMGQLFQVVRRQPQLKSNMPSYRVLNRLMPGLGNTVTEVTVTSPTEMSFLRKAPVGLTGFELTALAFWLESTNFPFGSFALPSR